MRVEGRMLDCHEGERLSPQGGTKSQTSSECSEREDEGVGAEARVWAAWPRDYWRLLRPEKDRADFLKSPWSLCVSFSTRKPLGNGDPNRVLTESLT